jgi:hypothetical protein
LHVTTVAKLLTVAAQVTAISLVLTVTVAIAQPRGSTAVSIGAVLDGAFGAATVCDAVTIVIAVAAQVTAKSLVLTITVAIAQPRASTAVSIGTVLNLALRTSFCNTVTVVLAVAAQVTAIVLIGTITVAIAQPRGFAAISITRAIADGTFRATLNIITVAIVVTIACQVTAPLLIHTITVAIAHPGGSTIVAITSAVLDRVGRAISAVSKLLTIA